MDAFCTVVRVIDNNRVFIVGGNKNIHTSYPDTQKQTMIYDVKNKKFELSKNLKFERWYGSAVITGDEKMFIFGGIDSTRADSSSSTIPEMIDLKNIDQGWQALEQSESHDLFGDNDFQEEWNYPRAFLASDGKPANLGADGSTPTGTQPILYLANPFATFQNNLGSGGNFTENGELTEGRTVRSAFANDFTPS